MTAELVLRAEAIGKVYGGTVALHDVDFEVERGRVAVLIGENGAGKTTLMRILAGVEPPTRGPAAARRPPRALRLAARRPRRPGSPSSTRSSRSFPT